MRLINLIPLKEIDFPNQKAFDAYNQKHQLRPDTKVTVAGKTTTAGQAAKKSEPVKGTSVFGKSKKSDGDLGGVQWNTPKQEKNSNKLPNKASELTYKHSSDIQSMLDSNSGLKGIAQINDNSGAMEYTASSGEYPTYTLFIGPNDDYGKPDEFRVSLESTYGNDPSNLSGKNDKSFKSSKDAMTYMTALAKKYRKELQMDDSDTK